MFKKFIKSAYLLTSQRGATMVEYTVMLALILVVAIATIESIGTKSNAKLTTVDSKLT